MNVSRTGSTCLGCSVVLINLDFDAAARSKLGNDNGICYLLEYCWVGITAQAIVEGVQIGSRDDEIQVKGLYR